MGPGMSRVGCSGWVDMVLKGREPDLVSIALLEEDEDVEKDGVGARCWATSAIREEGRL